MLAPQRLTGAQVCRSIFFEDASFIPWLMSHPGLAALWQSPSKRQVNRAIRQTSIRRYRRRWPRPGFPRSVVEVGGGSIARLLRLRARRGHGLRKGEMRIWRDLLLYRRYSQ